MSQPVYSTEPGVANSENEPQLGKIAWRFKYLLLLFGATGAALGYLYSLQQPPVYASSAQVLVSEKNSGLDLEGAGGIVGGRDSIETYIDRMLSDPVLEVAAAAPEVSDLARFSGVSSRSITRAIRKGLNVSVTERRSVLYVRFTGPTQEECQPILEAVLKAFESSIEGADQSDDEKLVELITTEKDRILNELQETEEAYKEFQQTTPLIAGVNPHTKRQADIEAQRAELVLRKARLESELQSIRTSLQRGGSREALLMMIGRSSEGGTGEAGNSPASLVAERLFPLLLEREMIAEEGLGKDHPKSRAVERQIEMTRQHLSEIAGGTVGDNSEPLDIVSLYIDGLAEELNAINLQDEKLATLFAEERTAGKELLAAELENSNYQSKLDRLSEAFDVFLTTLRGVNLGRDLASVETQVLLRPSEGVATLANQAKNIGVGTFGGAFIGFLLAYLLEMADKRFRSPDDIRNTLAAPVYGHIPSIRKRDLKRAAKLIARRRESDPKWAVTPDLLVVSNPGSGPAEAYRMVRTAIQFSLPAATDQRGNAICVTSPEPNDGKSTIAANIAAAFAMSGQKTLLFDADLRNPTVRRFFPNLDGDKKTCPTLLDVLEKDFAEVLPTVLHETGVDNLTLLPCLKRPTRPAELLSSLRFEALLEELRSQFDMIVFDTPPILAVSDPVAVAPRLDGVVLAMKLDRKSRKAGLDAIGSLRGVNAKVLGVVINDVDDRKSRPYRYYTHSYYYRSYGSTKYGSASQVESLDERESLSLSK